MNKTWKLVTMVVTGVVGSFYLFTNPRLIVQWGLGLGTRHNNRVIIGAILLIVAISLVHFFIRESLVGSERAAIPEKKGKRKR